MDKAKDESINKLIAGQEKMGKDISGMKEDISGMKEDISGMKEDISELKNGHETMKKDIFGMKEDIFGMKEDISELKHGQNQTDSLILKVLENMARLERIVVVNLENDLRTKVETLSDADKVRQHDTTELKQICREQEDRIEDHELRISRLEK